MQPLKSLPQGISLSDHFRDLADMLDGMPAGAGNEAVTPSRPVVPFGNRDIASLKAVMDMRKKRSRIFGPELFGEPDWDMMLELFRARLENSRLTVKQLTLSSGVPQTTAGRYLAQMIDMGYANCTNDTNDGRQKLVALSDQGCAMMRKLFAR